MTVTRLLALALLATACADPPAEPRPSDPAAPRAAAAAPEGRFTLAYDRGRRLPTALDSSGGCASELVAGSMTLSSGRFLLATTTRERCGSQTRQESRISEGTVTVAEGALRLDADSGSAIRAAIGRFAADSIVLTEIDPGSRSTSIDWTFAPRR